MSCSRERLSRSVSRISTERFQRAFQVYALKNTTQSSGRHVDAQVTHDVRSGTWTSHQRKLIGIADRLDRQIDIQCGPCPANPLLFWPRARDTVRFFREPPWPRA